MRGNPSTLKSTSQSVSMISCWKRPCNH